MKRTLLFASMLFCFAVSPVVAQEPIPAQPPIAQPPQPIVADANLPPASLTPELWMYMQEMRRQDDPKEAVRRNAEFRADQRRRRLAASKWFGYSNQRPTASVTPFTDSYSPRWIGNGGGNRWIGSQPYTARSRGWLAR